MQRKKVGTNLTGPKQRSASKRWARSPRDLCIKQLIETILRSSLGACETEQKKAQQHASPTQKEPRPRRSGQNRAHYTSMPK